MPGHMSPFTSGGSTRRPSYYPVTARSSIFPGSNDCSRRNSLSVEKPDIRILFKQSKNNFLIVNQNVLKISRRDFTLDHQERQIEKVFLEVTMQ